MANPRKYEALAENIFELLLAEIFGLSIILLDKIFYQILHQWIYSTLLAQDRYGYIEISIICPTQLRVGLTPILSTWSSFLSGVNSANAGVQSVISVGAGVNGVYQDEE